MTITDELRAFLREAFSAPADLASDLSLTEAGILDSRGLVELVEFVEQRFGIVVDDRDIHPDNLDSLDRIAAYVERRPGRAPKDTERAPSSHVHRA